VGFSLKKMFSGSGWRKFKRTVGGVATLAVGVVPGVGGLAGKVLTSQLGRRGVAAFKGGRNVMRQLKATPVMPGGAVSTPSGMVAPMVTPPSDYGGRRSPGGVRPRRKRKATTTTRRRKRKLKFGSPAWRKKYAKKRGRRS